MSVRKNSEIKSIQANEGTKVKKLFFPQNTQNKTSYSLAQFTLEPGRRTLRHKLRSSEIYYILEGQAVLKIDNESFEIKKDDSVYVPPMSEQYMLNIGISDLKFLCIVEPAWEGEDERITE